MYVFFSHESKYDLQLSDLHENCAHRVFLTDSEVFCLSHENILGHKTYGMTCKHASKSKGGGDTAVYLGIAM